MDENYSEQRLINTLVIDIETLPNGDRLSVEEMKSEAPKNYKNEDVILKWAEENVETEFRKRSLNSLKGRVLCIGAKWNDEPVRIFKYNEDESATIKEFGEYLNSLGHAIHSCAIVGHNFKAFDNPWLVQRGFKYGDQNITRLMVTHPRRDYRLQDTNDMFTLGIYGSYVKLKDMCEFLGVDTPKDDIDGSQVYDIFLQGELERIYTYCGKDVDATYKCYLKMQP